jgi:hypothetical protein
MLQFSFIRWDIQDERPEPRGDISRQFVGDPPITADEIGTEGFVILERSQPVDGVAFVS